MLSFWVEYIIAKEKLGVIREVSLAKIEAKYDLSYRQEVENLLPPKEGD